MDGDQLYNTDEILHLLNLERVDTDRFRGQSLRFMNSRSVFGGQVVGQALSAACMTVDGRHPHSLHSMFVLPGDPELPIEFGVERVRDGASFSVRRVVAYQNQLPIFLMTASFQRDEQGLSHQRPMPECADPETLASSVEIWHQHMRAAGKDFQPVAVDFRVEDGRDIFFNTSREHDRKVWVRSPLRLPEDPITHETLFAYVSDYGLLSTSLQPHGIAMNDPRLQMASLDHTIWFHRRFRLDDWLLLVMESPNASGGRGLNFTYAYDKTGMLVATVAQEGLIRLRADVDGK